MTDPRRLLDDTGLDPQARSALMAGKNQRGKASQREAIWAAIAPALPPMPDGGLGADDLGSAGASGPGAAGAGASGSSATTASGAKVAAAAKAATAKAAATQAAGSAAAAAQGLGWLGLLKAGAMGAGAMGALLGAQTILTPAPAPPRPAPPVAQVTPEIARASAVTTLPSATAAASAEAPPPRRPEPARATATTAAPREAPEAPAETAAPAPPPVPAAASVDPVSERLKVIRDEADMVQRARRALHEGNPGEALRLVDEARRLFPTGVLGQEREVLTILALARSGQQAQASARADAFLKAHPGSPFAGQLRPLVPGP